MLCLKIYNLHVYTIHIIFLFHRSAICGGYISKTGACGSVKYINNTAKVVESQGRCTKPEVCECNGPSPEPQYFYPDGPNCKRK